MNFQARKSHVRSSTQPSSKNEATNKAAIQQMASAERTHVTAMKISSQQSSHGSNLDLKPFNQ
jgi:hypothetical protein